jgi:hypothetical protein
LDRPFRRFGQFIRQRNHFDRPADRLNHPYQIGRDSEDRGQPASRNGRDRAEKREGVKKMFDMNHDLRSRQILAVVFAVLSGASAISTAVLPAILHF